MASPPPSSAAGVTAPRRKAVAFLYLLVPLWRSFRNRGKSRDASGRFRTLVLLLLGGAFWAGIFLVFLRVLLYFQSVEAIGTLLSMKILTMVMVVFFSLLLFSNLITALSTYFLSDDLQLLQAAPLPYERIYAAKFVETLLESSWMIVLFGLPVFGAYGVAFRAGWAYYAGTLLALIPLLVIAAGFGILCTLLLVRVLPARRTREILILLSFVLLVGLYVLFRVLQPERLFNDKDFSRFLEFLAYLPTPTSIYLPHHWFIEFLTPLLLGKRGHPVFFFLLLLSTAMALATLGSWCAEALYAQGLSRSQEGRQSIVSATSWVQGLIRFLTRPLGRQMRAIVRKDALTLLRDTTQWGQILLLGGLVAVYLYNFRALDLTRLPTLSFYVENLLSFLNMGLAGFVVAAVAIRFVFPAVSVEGKSFWIVRSSPISVRRFLWAKFWMYLVPLLLLSEFLIVVSNLLLHVTPFMMALSAVTVFCMTFGIVSLGVGLGAIHPRFHMENVARISTGYGAVLYMILSMGFIGLVGILEAWPVYVLFMARLEGTPLGAGEQAAVAGSFVLVALLNLAMLDLPIRLGARRLERREL